jgi:hypothetical protein
MMNTGNVASTSMTGRLAAIVLALVFGVCLVGFVGAPVASASEVVFGSEGEGAGEFKAALGVGINDETGSLYVTDRNNERVQELSRSGVFVRAWGWGVATGAAEFQSCTIACRAGGPGAGSGQFSGPAGVAVDNDPFSASHGDVYVEDHGNDRIEKFGPNGEFLLMFGGKVNATTGTNVCVAGETCQGGSGGAGQGEFEDLGEEGAISVGSGGEVYVGDRGRVQIFNSEGVWESQFAVAGGATVLALAAAGSSDVYLTEEAGFEAKPEVFEYTKTGTLVRTLALPVPAQYSLVWLATDSAGDLFVTDLGDGEGASVLNQRLLEYDSSGDQVLSLPAGNGTEQGGGLAWLESAGSRGEVVIVGPEGGHVRVQGVPPAGPVVIEGSASVGEVQPTSLSLGAVVNPEGEETSYRFEYGTNAAYGSSVPVPDGKLPAGFEDTPVAATITGLATDTTYHLRVAAINKCEKEPVLHPGVKVECVTDGPDQTFTTLPPAVIGGTSASLVSSESARLEAQLDPLGRETEYWFEWGLTAAYENAAPVPHANASSGHGNVPVSLQVAALQPGRVYHYRLVAHNQLGTAFGADETFTTQPASPSSTLPDGRAWEMVSPPDKQGVSLEAITEEGGVIQAAADGSALAYIAKAPIDKEPAGNRSIADAQVLATHTPTGWVNTDITTKNETVVGLNIGFPSEYQIFSSDLSAGIVTPEGPTLLSSVATESTPYRREADGEYVPLVTAANVPVGTHFGGEVAYESGTADLSHVVLASHVALTPGLTTNGEKSLFEWSSGSLQLVSVLPRNEAGEEIPAAEAGEGTQLASGGSFRNAVSEDGSRVVFETRTGAEHLYMRDMSRGESVLVDQPEAGITPGAAHPVFQDASSDDSLIYFTDTVRLTANAKARLNEPDLYVCEVTVVAGHFECVVRDLTVPLGAGEDGDVLGSVLGVSESGNKVYFVANGALTADVTRGDCVQASALPPIGLSCDLYMYDGTTGETVLVAVLSNRDFPDWNDTGPTNLGGLTARVSGNGRYVAFMSQESLTGYDNRDARSGARDEEVFLYDSAAGGLRCASCNQSGARPEGIFDENEFPGLLVDRPQNWGNQWLAASIPGWTRVDKVHALYQSRYLSDDGRLFFNAQDALVPGDENGKEDVYEFEPPNSEDTQSGNDCTTGSSTYSPSSKGCVSLISSGASGEESAFLDASESGNDVFFLTAAKLASEDVDRTFDVYDAHVCSAASPCLSSALTVPPPCNTTDSCRTSPSPQPNIFGAPASSTFSGAGNVAPSVPVVKPKAKAKPLTRAEKLANALKVCEKKSKPKRKGCEAQARKRYGPVHKAKKTDRRAK